MNTETLLRSLQISVGIVAALGGVAYYAGRRYLEARWGTLGIESHLLEFQTTDYMFATTNVFPIAVILVAALIIFSRGAWICIRDDLDGSHAVWRVQEERRLSDQWSKSSFLMRLGLGNRVLSVLPLAFSWFTILTELIYIQFAIIELLRLPRNNFVTNWSDISAIVYSSTGFLVALTIVWASAFERELLVFILRGRTSLFLMVLAGGIAALVLLHVLPSFMGRMEATDILAGKTSLPKVELHAKMQIPHSGIKWTLASQTPSTIVDSGALGAKKPPHPTVEYISEGEIFLLRSTKDFVYVLTLSTKTDTSSSTIVHVIPSSEIITMAVSPRK